MTERRLQSAVAQYLNAVLTPATWHTAIPGGDGKMTRAPGYVSGTPDYLVVHGGRALFIELKTPRGRPSDAQVSAWHGIEDASGKVVLCRSVDDVRAALWRWGVPTRDAARAA